jgi:hypothetical protein
VAAAAAAALALTASGAAAFEEDGPPNDGSLQFIRGTVMATDPAAARLVVREELTGLDRLFQAEAEDLEGIEVGRVAKVSAFAGTAQAVRVVSEPPVSALERAGEEGLL